MNERKKFPRRFTACLAFVGAMQQDLWFSGDSDVIFEVTWSKFEDAESGMKTYAPLIATSPCANQLETAPLPSIELSFKHQVTLKDGMPYFVCVYGFNHAGAFEVLVSASLSYDASPPHAGLVAFGAPSESTITKFTGGDALRVITKGKLCVYWTGFADADSGIRLFKVTVQSGRDVTSPAVVSETIFVSNEKYDSDEFQTVHAKCWEETTWGQWPKHDRLYARIVATNAVDMKSANVISNELALEATGSVTCSNLDVTSVTQVPGTGDTTHVARVEWSQCTAASGIRGYDIGYAYDTSAKIRWKRAFLRVTQSLEMSLPAQTKEVTFYLRATSMADNSNEISRPVSIDTQAFAVQYKVGCDVNSKTLTDYWVQKTASRACVTWTSSDKNLKQVRVMIGSVPGGHDIHEGVQAGSQGNLNYETSALGYDGSKYYVTLQLTDSSDNIRTVACTKVACTKVVIDTSPPDITRVATTREPIGDVLLLPSKQSDACFQVDVVETHSVGYRISVEIRDGGNLLRTLKSVNDREICLDEDIPLVSGKTYDIIVVATNQADVASEPMRRRFLLDSQPPRDGWVKFAPVFRAAPDDPDRPVSGELSQTPPNANDNFDQFQSDTKSLVLWLNPFTAASGMSDREYVVAVVPLNRGELAIDMNMSRAEDLYEKVVMEDLLQSAVCAKNIYALTALSGVRLGHRGQEHLSGCMRSYPYVVFFTSMFRCLLYPHPFV